jgi:hypothetical protein
VSCCSFRDELSEGSSVGALEGVGVLENGGEAAVGAAVASSLQRHNTLKR